MRLLFVSSTTGGGSGRSQRELADGLRQRGHQVLFLVDDKAPARLQRWTHEQLSDLAIRAASSRLDSFLRRLERCAGRRSLPTSIDGLPHLVTPIPQNALARTLDEFQPDVVIGNSLVRLSWRRIHSMCREAGIPTVLYVREINSLDHLVPGEHPEAVVANARSLAAAVEARGVGCTFLPSVIDLALTRTSTTRRVALLVNPIPSHGIAVLWELAARLPQIEFAIQESWPLARADLAGLRQRTAMFRNVELRRRCGPGPELYGDARVLLVPHLIDNRPRVVVEAQANGIPVIAAAEPGLKEVVGNGGVTLGVDQLDAWCAEITRLWNDTAHYERLVERALRHSARPEIDPDAITATFERILVSVIDRRQTTT